MLCPANGKWVMSPLSTKRVKRQTKTTISRIFERVMFDQLCTSFTSTFSSTMSGFRKAHSWATALIKLTDDGRRALDLKKDVGVAAIDLSKAFDCIWHSLLLAKLKAYGVQQPALQLIRSYLHDRKQRVICNDSSSNLLLLRCGVPQGSLLSPLLFNTFMNDISETGYRLVTPPLCSQHCPIRGGQQPISASIHLK